MSVKNYTISDFAFGQMDKVKPQDIPDGASAAMLNWLTTNKKIELRRGYAPVGVETDGNGRISGLKVGNKVDGTQIPFRTRGQKIEFYDASLATPDWTEIGSSQLGSAADGEDVIFSNYNSLAGNQTWLSSPNSGLYKIMVANPGSITDEYLGGDDHTTAYNRRGYIAIKQNRMFLWGAKNDIGGVYNSWIDKVNVGDYTAITGEAIGSLGSLTYSGTLAFKAAGTRRTCLVVTFTDTSETFSDNGSGVLTGSAGGTGTINYTTGAYSVTFNSVAVGAVTATYRWEDSSSQGIADFSFAGTRVAGTGNLFRQNDGGPVKLVASLKTDEYCFHTEKIWDIIITLDDTNSRNVIFRDNIGIPSIRGAYATGDGIYAINIKDKANPTFVLLSYSTDAVEVIPNVISDNLDLSSYYFNNAVVFPFNDYICFACASSSTSGNDTFFVFNRTLRKQLRRNIWDRLDYFASTMDTYNGTLIAGDSVTNNVYTLFSGDDDNQSLISNYWRSGISLLGIGSNNSGKPSGGRIKTLKKVKRATLEGEIGPEQIIRLYVRLDRGSFVEVRDEDDTALDDTAGAFIKGSGGYVDRTQRVSIGATTIGTETIGGGSGGVTAYHYERTLPFAKDKFREIEYMFVAEKIGYASVSSLTFRDIRIKQDKVPRKYRN